MRNEISRKTRENLYHVLNVARCIYIYNCQVEGCTKIRPHKVLPAGRPNET